MNADTLRRELMAIADMPRPDHNPELASLVVKCKAAGYEQTKGDLKQMLTVLIKAADAEDDFAAIEEDFAVLNEKYFLITVGSSVKIGTWIENATGRRMLVLYSRADFLTLVENQTIPGPKEPLQIGPLWLKSRDRREYKGTVLKPDGDVPEGYLNLWQGWGVEPTCGDCQIILDHIHDVLCAGNRQHSEYMLNWIALKIQMPTRVMGVMPVFISEEGAGKGVIFDTLLMRIFGPHGLYVNASKQLTGNFNLHLLDACYVFADECFFVGNKADTQRMKSIITGQTLMVEAKGIDSVPVASYLGIIAATNMDHAVNVKQDDRRTVVGKCSLARKGDHKYFDKLFRHINGDGASHFLREMLARDVSNFNAERDRPLTDATIEQREMSLTGVEAWWQEVVESGRLLSDCLTNGMSQDPDAWKAEPVTISRREVIMLFTDWKKRRPQERYENYGARRIWHRLKQIACFSDAEKSTSDRCVVFETLDIQIKSLNEYLRGEKAYKAGGTE